MHAFADSRESLLDKLEILSFDSMFLTCWHRHGRFADVGLGHVLCSVFRRVPGMW